jgi:hypothetical protein
MEHNIEQLRKLQENSIPGNIFGKLFGPGILKYMDKFVVQGHRALFPIPNKAAELSPTTGDRERRYPGLQWQVGRASREMSGPGTVPSFFLNPNTLTGLIASDGSVGDGLVQGSG